MVILNSNTVPISYICIINSRNMTKIELCLQEDKYKCNKTYAKYLGCSFIEEYPIRPSEGDSKV